MEVSEYLSTVENVFAVGRAKDLMFQYADDQPVDGRTVWLSGQQLISFGSCSYLGLENDPRMKEGVLKATERFGTQFSCSRGYVSAGPYRDIEERFSEVFGGHALVTPTTTLGHMATIPVLIHEKDAIILDHQVHASVQVASTLAKANGAHVEVVRHGELAKLEERVAELCRTKRHVWHMIDGVFSMFGDLPDVAFLTELLAKYEQFHLYVDDAHGMSCDGKHGRGIHLARMPPHPRVILGTSFAKAFAAGGGCFVFPTWEMKERVRMCGAPLTFGGPMQPPMLGALSAGLDIHLSDEIYTLQGELKERIDLFNDLCVEKDLPLLVRNHSPVFFIKMGQLRLAWNVAARLRDQHGIFVNVSPYPTVPMKRSGLRIALTRNHTLEDIRRIADAIADVLPQAYTEEGLSREDTEANFAEVVENHQAREDRKIRQLFDVSGDAPIITNKKRVRGPFTPPQGMELQHTNSVLALNKEEWDDLLADRGNFDWRSLSNIEGIFRNRSEPENNWNFHYFVVRQDGKPILATYFTEALWKDDALMRAEVSELIEEKRQSDPYFLTSRCFAMGSMMTEGNHLYIDRTGPWQAALAWVLAEADKLAKEKNCTNILLRDLPDGDAEMDQFLLDAGLVKTPMLAGYELNCAAWKDDKEFLASLSSRTRKYMREEILGQEHAFEMKVYKKGVYEPTDAELDQIYDLYMGVKTRKLRLNTFEYPRDIFRKLLESDGWEIIALHLKPEFGGPEDGRAVGMGCCFGNRDLYTAFMCGSDNVRRDIHVYRQLLWKTIRRTRALGFSRLELGLDADTEKLRLGAEPRPQCIYMQFSDHFAGDLIGQVVQEVALQKALKKSA